MKQIYIVLTHTGTTLSKIIKTYTRAEFSHISISLDEELNRMYSFGRLKPYNPFIGGFVHEYISKGTFKRFKNTWTTVYALNVTDEQYDIIEKSIEKFKKEKDEYKFNIIGLFAVAFNIKIRLKNAYYCAEFVKFLMERADIKNELPEIIKPEDFKQVQGLKPLYSGLLREYRVAV